MKYNILIRPEAEKDLEKIFSWYELKRKGLGFDFFLNVEAAMTIPNKARHRWFS
ncbi:hypothetical protein JW935_05735 [candidate division KSB1 bacterium]|nr:hypothetical protein [candidate division KSB1 bacterium]